MSTDNFEKAPYTQNRELSWLQFNERVLSEAMDETVPLLEQLKFIAIFQSNLDEFFMVRVGKLFDVHDSSPHVIDKKSGWTSMEQIHQIYQAVKPLYIKKDQLFAEVTQRLAKNGVCHLRWAQLSEKQKKFAKQYFIENIQPILSPLIINAHHPFPHLENNKIYIVATIPTSSKTEFAIIPIHASLPAVLFFPGERDTTSFLLVEDIILEFAELVLKGFKFEEKLKLKVTRNTDIKFEDDDLDYEEDFRDTVKQKLKKRKRLSPTKLELSTAVSENLANYLAKKLDLLPSALYESTSDMNLGYAFELSHKLSHVQKKVLEYPELTPYVPANINLNASMMEQVRQEDFLLLYPFESMAPFLALIKEAAYDKSVISIKITIYRLSSSSKLVDYLCAAAENGKEVSILIELRARFDEQNNIDWSERLEQAGCSIIYGFEGFKVHSKICLITRREKNGIKHYTQIGTGNYNEKTAKQYTDLSLLTYNQDIGNDANEFFKNMGIGNLAGQYRHLLVAPTSFKDRILALIQAEAVKGEKGYIFIKINSLTDLDIINALQAASCQGVKIELIIRGISCMISQLEGITEHITISSIVGRFLEHSRIYKFGQREDALIFIGSADFMTRNMERRVEVAVPITKKYLKQKVNKLIELCLNDNMKARTMTAQGEYMKMGFHRAPINSQDILLAQYLDGAPRPAPVKKSIVARLHTRLENLFQHK